MKKFYYLISVFFFFFFSSCERFYPPEIKLQMVNEGDTLYHFYGVIIDGGGAESFNSKGCVYGLSKDPTLLDGESNFFEIISSQDSWFYDWPMLAIHHFPVSDTTYYVRGWVKTNAGIGYSNPVRVEILAKENIFF